MLKTLTLSVAASLTLCACETTAVTTPPANCAGLIPDAWAEGVQGVPIPPATPAASDTLQARLDAAIEAARQWAGAYVGESAQRDKANGRTADAIRIFKECEAKANKARPR